MKIRTVEGLKLAALPVVLGVVSCSSTAPQTPPDEMTTVVAYTTGVAGGQRVDTIAETTTVVAIDKVERVVTLRTEDGATFTVNVGPEAVNFDQIGVGDTVEATLAKSVVIYIADDDSAEGAAVGAVQAGAPQGGQPGGLVAGVVQFSGTVTAIDLKNRTATLRFSDGSVVTSAVRSDVDLTRYKVGQKVVFRVTGLVTVEVKKP